MLFGIFRSLGFAFILFSSFSVHAIDVAQNSDKKLPTKKLVRTKPEPPPVISQPESSPTPEEPPAAQSYQFNTLGTPANTSEREVLKFKIPVTPKQEPNAKAANPVEKSASPVENAPNNSYYQTYPSYPKYSFGLNYAPSFSGFKQEYNGLPLNFSSNSLTSLELGLSYLSTPHWSFGFDIAYYTVSVKAKDLGLYSIKASTATVMPMIANGAYCFIYDSASHKLCTGIALGIDGYPSLDFADSTNIEITTIKDLVVGVNLAYSYPILNTSTLFTQAGYFSGLKNGQNDNLAVQQDSKFAVEAGVDSPGQQTSTRYLVFLEQRKSSVEGKSGAIIDKWTTDTQTFGIKLSYTWTWEAQALH